MRAIYFGQFSFDVDVDSYSNYLNSSVKLSLLFAVHFISLVNSSVLNIKGGIEIVPENRTTYEIIKHFCFFFIQMVGVTKNIEKWLLVARRILNETTLTEQQSNIFSVFSIFL